MLKSWNLEMMVRWNTGILKCWNLKCRMLTSGNPGILQCWNAGLLECRNHRILQSWNPGTLESWNLHCWNAEIIESWNPEILESWIAGILYVPAVVTVKKIPRRKHLGVEYPDTGETTAWIKHSGRSSLVHNADQQYIHNQLFSKTLIILYYAVSRRIVLAESSVCPCVYGCPCAHKLKYHWSKIDRDW